MSSKYESKQWQKKVELDCENGKAECVKTELFKEEGGKKELLPLLKTTRHWKYSEYLFLVSVQF